MKKKLQNLFAISLTLICSATIAQPTLTAIGNTPVPGDILTYSNDTVSFNPGSAGANQTWNEAAITSTSNSVANVVTVASTTNGSSFPLATVAMQYGTTYSYYKGSSSALQNCGYSANGVNIVYSNLEDMMRFPFTYNNTYTDTWGATFTNAGYTYYRKGIDTVTADGYGTLITPHGTYTNVTRVHFTQTYSDSTSITGIPIVIGYYNNEYLWFKDGIHTAIASTFTLTLSTGSSTHRSSYVSGSTGVKEFDNSNLFSLFPNPASNNVSIQFDLTENKKVSTKLYNSLGAEVKASSMEYGIQGTNTMQIDVAELPEGIYFIQLIIDNGTIQTRKFEIKK